jgi:hypothetical protein
MSAKYDKIPLSRDQDRRVKLTDMDKTRIKRLHKEGVEIREISRRFTQVSRRMIQFILFPERIKAARVNYDWKKYYTKEKRRKYQMVHRHYKSALYKSGLLTTNGKDDIV